MDRMKDEELARIKTNQEPLNFDDMEYGDLNRIIYKLLRGLEAERETIQNNHAECARLIRVKIERINKLEAQISVYGQAIVLCDSTDPDNPVMSGELYRKAMKLLELDDE